MTTNRRSGDSKLGVFFVILAGIGVAGFLWKGGLETLKKQFAAPAAPQQQQQDRPPASAPVAEAKPNVATPAVAERKPVEDSSEVGIGQPAVVGDVAVTVVGTGVDHVRLRSHAGDSQSPDAFLVVRLEIRNKNLRRKLEYQSFAHQLLGYLKPKLSDDAGKQYQEAFFPQAKIADQVSGAVGQPIIEDLYADKPLNDVLVFERPADSAKLLHLELPARNVGGEGNLHFRFAYDATQVPPPVAAKETKDAKEPAKDEAESSDTRRSTQDDADRYLRLTKVLIQDGKTDKASERLKYLIDKYPNTETAKEAKKLLDSLKK
jgi:hypothetical protein